MRKGVVLIVLLAALVAPAAAQAHPLGNFTTNQFSRIEVSGPRLYVLYVLDLAEIPTFQAGEIDQRAYARKIASGVRLQVDGRRAPLVAQATDLAHPPGAGGLETTRLEIVLRGPRLSGVSDVRYRDTNYAERIGWKEIVVGKDAPSPSHELRAYPADLLRSPLDVTSVTARLAPAAGPGEPPSLGREAGAPEAPDHADDSGFASLISHDDLGFWFVLGALGAAFFWGAAHALSPGHGKTIVTAYLVGRRGTPRHALLLGGIVTITHTIGVFALGLVTLFLSEWVAPESLYPWLNLVAGLLVVGVGGSVLWARWKRRGAPGHGHAHHHHDHDHHDDHHHDYTSVSTRSLVAVGVSGGLLPCPSALVVLLAAISLHRIGLGLILILAFSAGLALTITAIGLIAIFGKRRFSRLSFEGRLVGLLPAVSALAIVVLGLVMTAHALPSLS